MCGALAGCSSVPGAGPNVDEVVAQSRNEQVRRFEMFDVDDAVVDVVNSYREPSLSSRFGDRRPPADAVIGVGDYVSVTIWEAGNGGLFSTPVLTDRASSGSNSATVPDQVVGRDGAITVPYAGRIHVAGRTPQDVQELVEKKLGGKAIEPQVLVNITRPTSNTVTVTGEVVNGSRVPLSVRGDRVLDVIATAGGLRAPVNETYVLLSRGKNSAVVAMTDIVSTPSENIYMRPGDVLTLVRQPKVFFAYGATGRNAEIPFDFDGISVAQGMAKAGGLIDLRADPAGVFVLRYERPEVVRRLRPDSPLLAEGRAFIPVVYRLNLRQANGLFLAQVMRMHNRDMLYVSNAPLADVGKVMQVFNSLSAPAMGAAAIAIAAQ